MLARTKSAVSGRKGTMSERMFDRMEKRGGKVLPRTKERWGKEREENAPARGTGTRTIGKKPTEQTKPSGKRKDNWLRIHRGGTRLQHKNTPRSKKECVRILR